MVSMRVYLLCRLKDTVRKCYNICMKKSLFFAIAIFALLVSFQLVFVQTNVLAQTGDVSDVAPKLIQFTPSVAGLDLTGCNSVSNRNSFLGCYISSLYTFLVQAAIILAVLMIVVGGFQYLFALGNQGKIGEAKETIQVSIIGLVLALTSYLLFSLINPNIVNLNPLPITDVTLPATVQTPGFQLTMCNGATSEPNCVAMKYCVWVNEKCESSLLRGADVVTNYCAAVAADTYDSTSESSDSYRYICCSHVDNMANDLLAVPRRITDDDLTICTENLINPNPQFPYQVKSILNCITSSSCLP